eukprot:gene22462-biopygen5751
MVTRPRYRHSLRHNSFQSAARKKDRKFSVRDPTRKVRCGRDEAKMLFLRAVFGGNVAQWCATQDFNLWPRVCDHTSPHEWLDAGHIDHLCLTIRSGVPQHQQQQLPQRRRRRGRQHSNNPHQHGQCQ